MFGFKKQRSGQIAKNRLQLVIYQDRMSTNPEAIEMLKSDILKVIRNYMDIDEDAFDLKVGPSGNSDVPALEVNIPIKGWKVR